MNETGLSNKNKKQKQRNGEKQNFGVRAAYLSEFTQI